MRTDPPAATLPRAALAVRVAFVLTVAALLASGLVGGLLRAGVALPLPAQAWPGHAVLGHAFLMIDAFLGTVIGIERAVAVKARVAFVAPVASALSGLLMLAGDAAAAMPLAVAASFAFIAVNATVVSRQVAAHTLLLLVAALAWLVGNLLAALGARAAAVVPWWFAFLVLTIAAERLEMTRLMRRRRGAAAALYAGVAALLAGAALFALAPSAGTVVYGLALLGLALWLAVFDIARRTVASPGLSRYMAVCLLAGYAWLGVSGIAWVAGAFGWPARDAALHALGLGFIVSMVFAHAPVILPAVAGIKLHFGGVFYLPLALLHGSLVVRVFLAPADARWLAAGAAGNAAAIALFAATVAAAAVTWRVKHPTLPSHRHGLPAPR